jgi:N utilization substance protein B
LPAGGARRLARERALGLLYEAEAKGRTPSEVLAELPTPPEPYAVALVEGVGERTVEIDELLASHAVDWKVERMPAVDRNLLRMATLELIAIPDTPTGVVISEAVELAKEYSTEESGRFVNGVLAAIAAEVRPPEPGSPARAARADQVQSAGKGREAGPTPT